MKSGKFYFKGLLAGAIAVAFMVSPGAAFSREDVCAGKLICTPSAEGEIGFHHHLVRPGTQTTYILQVCNIYSEPRGVRLNIETEVPLSWRVELEKNYISDLASGTVENVLLTLKPSRGVPAKEVVSVEVSAQTDYGEKAEFRVKAETTLMRKIYFVSIDSLDPAYLKLNSKGTGYGSRNDWLMPNLHQFMERAVFYPNAKVHIITATDMNHFNFLAGTKTGTSGISMVGGFFFGFDEKGQAIIRGATQFDRDIVRYGSEGKHVPSLFNAVKDSNPNAWTCFISGKNWVPELMRRPEFQLDRIIHGADVPFYIEPVGRIEINKMQFLGRGIAALLPGPLPPYAHQLGNPAGLDEPQDKRQQYELARLTGSYPMNFPPDEWVMDAALTEIMNEDPDVFYILLAAVDDAGHAFGSAFELDEWDDNGTPDDVTDDVSKYDHRASRQGILNVVKEADAQFARLVEFLERRGTLDELILVLESDHSMVTHYRRALDMKAHLEKACDLSMETDYFFGSATSIGLVSARRDDPAIIPAVEAALEEWKVENPVIGVMERAAVIYNREEMKTGVDQSTGKAWLLPGEYYSEYYIENRKPGDQVWADLLVLAAPHYKFKIQNFGLANLGMATLPIKIPEWGYFIGGHGSFDARAGLLMVQVPGARSRMNQAEVYTMDVAPTLYRLQGWPIPECVDGKGLPGIDPMIH
jgi:predicted AlkP superfamily pyrophosphatase or phosphodiesterase